MAQVPDGAAAPAELNEGGAGGGGQSGSTEGSSGGMGSKQRNLRKKLFRLKNLGELQDTDANNDDSQFKVRWLGGTHF